MPGYISKLLQRFLRPTPQRPDHQPHQHVQTQNGNKVQLTESKDKTLFRLDQSMKHTHTNLHAYAKTYQNTLENSYISHQMANIPAD